MPVVSGINRPSMNETADRKKPVRDRSTERETPPREQRKHDEPDRRNAQPERLLRSVQCAVPDDHLEHCRDGQEDDQCVEPVAPCEYPEACSRRRRYSAHPLAASSFRTTFLTTSVPPAVATTPTGPVGESNGHGALRVRPVDPPP